jgi:hypothetical protein
MPMPTTKDLHVDSLLTNVSIAYRNKSFIADDLFPIVPVVKQSDYIPKFPKSHWFRDLALKQADGVKAPRIGYSIKTSDRYVCDRYHLATDIYDQQRSNADRPFDLERNGTELVTMGVQLKRERSCAATAFVTGAWATDLTGTTDFVKWSSYATSTPTADVEAWRDTINGMAGGEPNCMTMGSQVLLKLKWHPDIIDSIKYVQKGIVTEDLLKELFGVDYFLVGRAIYTTSPEVASTAYGTTAAGTDQETLVSYSRVWGKHVLLTYRPPAASLMTPAAGYTFVWNRVPNAIQFMQRFRDEELECDTLVANSYFDHAITASDSGLLASSAVA